MYMRSYPESREDTLVIPDNYDGSAFRQSYIPNEKNESTESRASSVKDAEECSAMAGMSRGESGVFSLLKDSFVGRFLFGKDQIKLGPMKLGNEEILIIGVAILLFFSKGADKECGIILLMLLLIN